MTLGWVSSPSFNHHRNSTIVVVQRQRCIVRDFNFVDSNHFHVLPILVQNYGVGTYVDVTIRYPGAAKHWAGAARTAGVRYCSGVYCVRLLMHDSADPICMVVAVGGEDASAGSIAALGCCLLVCAISTIDCVYVFYGIVLNARRLKAVVA